ncbi:asl2555 [Nostoc sp. PCC 7120 = FACHB-418]|nr:asl2555 [Nostoc sp. PCC 7120 = FACHB-418]
MCLKPPLSQGTFITNVCNRIGITSKARQKLIRLAQDNGKN